MNQKEWYFCRIGWVSGWKIWDAAALNSTVRQQPSPSGCWTGGGGRRARLWVRTQRAALTQLLSPSQAGTDQTPQLLQLHSVCDSAQGRRYEEWPRTVPARVFGRFPRRWVDGWHSPRFRSRCVWTESDDLYFQLISLGEEKQCLFIEGWSSQCWHAPTEL